eukprot:3278869-Prorocentrum_lima.AAC.1
MVSMLCSVQWEGACASATTTSANSCLQLAGTSSTSRPPRRSHTPFSLQGQGHAISIRAWGAAPTR